MTDFYEYFNKMPKSWKVFENQRFEKLTDKFFLLLLPQRLRANISPFFLLG